MHTRITSIACVEDAYVEDAYVEELPVSGSLRDELVRDPSLEIIEEAVPMTFDDGRSLASLAGSA